MLTQNPVTQTSVKTAIARCQEYLLSLQKPEGYWWANLESNVTITAEGVLLYKIWGIKKRKIIYWESNATTVVGSCFMGMAVN